MVMAIEQDCFPQAENELEWYREFNLVSIAETGFFCWSDSGSVQPRFT
jgi:hypothetical protein